MEIELNASPHYKSICLGGIRGVEYTMKVMPLTIDAQRVCCFL
jgi:hypothetical protein